MANNIFNRDSNSTSPQIKRGSLEEIANSLKEAILFLNTTEIKVGKVYMKRYLAFGSRTKVNVVVAVGISDGIGESCYKIISEAGKIVVWDIVNSLPDVSDVLNGQIYIYVNETREQNYLVYIKTGTRIVEPIQFPIIVLSTKDNRLYYASSKTVVDIYDHLENCLDMDLRLIELEKKVDELYQGITPTPPEEETTTTTTTTPTPSIPLRINSFSMDCDEQHEVGETLDITFNWEYNYNEIDSQTLSGETIDNSLRTKKISGINSDSTFTLSVTKGNQTVNSSKRVFFSPKAFVGGGRVSISSITPENFYEIFSGNNNQMNSDHSNIICSGSTTKTFKFEQKSYILLAFPKDKCSNFIIKDLNNFDVTFHTKEISVINSFGETISYVIYQSPAASTEFTFVFKF